ncbi:MAG: protein kinase [Gammaproteobacteria bacterium]|nr:protein kinase [Gammaproteobacteria bacterium]MDH5226128.1 protein kinase [Gammaproteobacteria bacterium]
MQRPPHDDPDRTEELDETLFPSPSDRPLQGPVTLAEVRQGVVLRDRYWLGAPIANTGQSIVFAARDLLREPDHGEAVELAVKVLAESRRQMPYAIARLKREFRQTQSLRHPGVVRMYDLDRELDTWFITMERLEGVSLKRRLDGDGTPLNTAEALRIAFACADVLEFAHNQGTPHGDFKPGNVFIENGGAVRVLDFGTAPDIFAEFSEVAADEGQIPRAATRAYASPQVLDGQAAEARDDIFSFACVVYEMLAGRHPFGRVPSNWARNESTPVEPLPQLTPEQNAQLLRGLAWTREARPGSASELIQSILKPPVPPTAAQLAAVAAPETLPPSPRSPARWGLWLGAAAIVAIAGWWMFYTAQHENVSAGLRPKPTPIIRPATPPPERAAIGVALPANAADPPAAAVSDATPTEEKPRPTPRRPKPRVRIADALVFATEGAPSAVIVLQRDGDRTQPVEVSWKATGGSAHVGQDFDGPTQGVVKFRSGQTSRALYIPLIDDTETETQEFVTIMLSSRTADLGGNTKIKVTIGDND